MSKTENNLLSTTRKISKSFSNHGRLMTGCLHLCVNLLITWAMPCESRQNICSEAQQTAHLFVRNWILNRLFGKIKKGWCVSNPKIKYFRNNGALILLRRFTQRVFSRTSFGFVIVSVSVVSLGKYQPLSRQGTVDVASVCNRERGLRLWKVGYSAVSNISH